MLRDVVLGNFAFQKGKPAICVPVCGSSKEEVLWETGQLAASACDLIEWRADYFAEDIASAVSCVRRAAGEKPLLVTYRSRTEGGRGTADDAAYAGLLREVIRSGSADAVDLELSRPGCKELAEFARAHRVVTVISYHNFERTLSGEELEEKLRAMEAAGGDIPKLAMMPREFSDVLRLAEFSLKASESCFPLITVSMGSLGKVSRLWAGQVGSAVTFAADKISSAPGQIKLPLLRNVLDELEK